LDPTTSGHPSFELLTVSITTSTEDIKKNVMILKAISQQEFQKCFQQWQHHWAKCVVTQG